MTTTEVTGFLNQVESMFNFEYRRGAKAKLIQGLKSESIEGSIKTIKTLEEKFTKLPSPVELIRLVREHSAQLRQAESDERRKNSPSEIPHRVNGDYVKRSCQLIHAVMSGKLDRGKILEGFRVMDDKYPNHGWGVQGSILQRDYAKDNLDLSKVPAMAGKFGNS